MPQPLAQLVGVDAGLRALGQFVDDVERSKVQTLDYVARHVLNYARKNAPFTDRTGTLRRGYTHQILHHDYMGIEAPVAIVANTTEYAVHVEMKSGYWVLSGAILALMNQGLLPKLAAQAIHAKRGGLLAA